MPTNFFGSLNEKVIEKWLKSDWIKKCLLSLFLNIADRLKIFFIFGNSELFKSYFTAKFL